MKIKHVSAKNCVITVCREEVEFDGNGIGEISDEAGMEAVKIPGYEIASNGSNPDENATTGPTSKAEAKPKVKSKAEVKPEESGEAGLNPAAE